MVADTAERERFMPDGKEETHPCYGQVRISKFQGDSNFFGSNVTHKGGITIQISRASYQRSLSHNWIHGNESLIEVQLSPLQFAELITTGMNTEGVPCTIRSDHTGFVEQANFADDVEHFKNEYNENVQNQISGIAEAIQLVDDGLSAKSVKKSDLNTIKSRLVSLQQDIVSNMPYVKKSFTQHIQKTILEAKTSVECFIESRVISLGLKSLQDLSSKKLGEGK